MAVCPPLPPIRLLALDIDGTLLNSQSQVSPGNLAALERARAAGLELVLATGRRYSRALPLVAPLGLEAPLVTHGGALVKHPRGHQTLFQARLPRELLRSVIEVVDRQGHETLVYADTYLAGYDYYCRRLDSDDPHLGEYLRKNPGCGRALPELVDAPHEALAAFAMGTRAAMQRLAERLDAELPGELTTHVLRSPFYEGFMCEIAPAGTTKWSAIERLARERGIPAAAICAVGDDVNDLAMIRGAGLGVAMGNASAEVQAAAQRVAPHHDADGVAAVVGWILGE